MQPFVRYNLVAVFSLILAGPVFAQQQAVVQSPIADLRRIPTIPDPGTTDDFQETQLLLGETVDVLQSSGDWVRVAAPTQQEFSHHGHWEGYPGWVLKSELIILSSSTAYPANTDWKQAVIVEKWSTVWDHPGGTLLMKLPLDAQLYRRKHGFLFSRVVLPDGRNGWIANRSIRLSEERLSPVAQRKLILSTARLLIGDPYVWGGRSPYDSSGETRLSGVDCSGLVHMSYHVAGVTIPRDALEQSMKATSITRAQLLPGDLIFLAPRRTPKNVIHVMIYAGGDMLIEAPKMGVPVRQVTCVEKMNKPLSTLESGDTVGERLVTFGRYLSL